MTLPVPLARAALPTRLRGLLVPGSAWALAGRAGAVWIDVPVERLGAVALAPNVSGPHDAVLAVVAPALGSVRPGFASSQAITSGARAPTGATPTGATSAALARGVALVLALRSRRAQPSHARRPRPAKPSAGPRR